MVWCIYGFTDMAELCPFRLFYIEVRLSTLAMRLDHGIHIFLGRIYDLRRNPCYVRDNAFVYVL